MDYLKDNKRKVLILFYNFNNYIDKLSDLKKFDNFTNVIRKNENINIVVVDDYLKLKALQFADWFRVLFNLSDGLWIGKGVSEQTLFHISAVNKEMLQNFKNNMGYLIAENRATLCKLIDFQFDDEGDKE